MRRHRWVLITIILFFLFSSLIAQNKIPEIVKKIEPSVVLILTYDKEGKLLAQGTGFFVDPNGDVIINRHVLLNAFSAEVKTAQGRTYPITRIVAEDKEGDLIRVSVNIPKKDVIPLSVSVSLPEVGERIIVITPSWLERAVADGIVSAVQNMPGFGKMIQITAPISSGSSGSPVVNMKGEVIGMATFQLVEGQTLNFAIPGERIARLKRDKEKTFAEWQLEGTEESLTSAEELYATGIINLWARDYEEALSYFEEVVKKNPRNADAYFYIGVCNGKLGRYTEAAEAFKQAIRDYAEAHNYLGVAYAELGRYKEAVEAFKQAIHIEPDDANAHYNLGVTYVELGYHKRAVEAFKQAICIKPDLIEAQYNLGMIYGKLGRYEEATEAFKQAIRIDPHIAEAHCNLGLIYGKFGHYKEAVKAFKQAIRIKPDYAEAHNYLGVAYAELGRYKEAVEAFKQAIRIKPDYAEAHNFLGVAYVELGRYKEAVKAFKQAIGLQPDYAEARYSLGEAYLMLGDKGSALKEYEVLKELDKSLADELLNLIRNEASENQKPNSK